MKALKTVSFLLSISIGVLLVAFYLFEITLFEKTDGSQWSFDPESPSAYTWQIQARDSTPLSIWRGLVRLELHPWLGLRSVPNQKHANFSIGPEGLRDFDLDVHQQSSKESVLVIGGSTVFGTGLSTDADTIPAQLQMLFKNKVRVINGGTLGYRSQNEIQFLESFLPKIRPKLVIAIHGYNDFYSLVGESKENSLYNFAGFDQLQNKIELFGQLQNSPSPFRALRAFALSAFPRSSRLLGIKGFKKPTAKPFTEKEIQKFFLDNLSIQKRVSEQQGAAYYSFLQIERLGSSTRESSYTSFATELTKESKRLGLQVRNLHDFSTEFAEEDFIDTHHFTASGSRKVAQLLFQTLNLGDK